jgi:hypothetical protein
MSAQRQFLDDPDIKIRAHFNDDDTFRVCINIPAGLGRLVCSRSMPMSIYSEVSRAFDHTRTDDEARNAYMLDRVEHALWELGQIKMNLENAK